MNELSTIQDYRQFKDALGTELRNQAEGFVRTGYLLKVARDTDILRDSGYATVAEFALAEYGLSKDVVSRYIAINDRYSKDGYSEYLQDKFEGYGVAKLQEMLTLPDTVVELMSPEMTKREIQDIKKEIKEEEQISDIEVYCEGTAPDQEHMTTLQKVIHKYFYEQREEYIRLEEVIGAKIGMSRAVEKVLDVLAPSGMALKTVRVQGIGKLMISFKGKENDIEMLNVRSNEKEVITWQQFIESLSSTFAGRASKRDWETIYGEPFETQDLQKEEKKQEVAPVQLKKEAQTRPGEKEVQEKTNQETLHAVEPSIPLPEPVEQDEQEQVEAQTEEAQSEEDLPGQQDLETDYRETMPENVINTPCEPDLEEGKTQDQEGLSPVQEIILKRAQILMENVRQKKWEEAMADVRQLDECIRQAGGCE